jgi:hypothetical protein
MAVKFRVNLSLPSIRDPRGNHEKRIQKVFKGMSSPMDTYVHPLITMHTCDSEASDVHPGPH